MNNELNDWIEPELIRRYHQYKTDSIKCYDDATKRYYCGKASAINEVLILLFNTDLNE